MKALDTNIIIRFLVKDDVSQSEAVYRLFKHAESEKITFFVPLLVMLETIWVLSSVYEIPRKEILDVINDILYLPILKFEGQTALKQFLVYARDNNADLSDILISSSTRQSGCESVLSFDKKAAKSGIFELLS